MAQFDVYASPFRQRATVPYVVVLQSNRCHDVPTRIVGPFVIASAAPNAWHYLAPHFAIAGHDVVFDPFNIATVHVSRLVQLITSLTDDDSRAKLVRAMDELLSQA